MIKSNLMIKRFIFMAFLCLMIGFFINGCSSKKHFEPQTLSGKIHFNGKLSAAIQSVSREGAVLKDHTLLTLAQGITPLLVKKDYKFLTQNNNIFVLQKQCQEIMIIETNAAQNTPNIHTIPFDKCILSATFKGNKLAMVLLDNTLVYYDASKQKEIFSQKYPPVLAINSYLAAPKITSEYVIYPDLEGKILIYSIAQNKIIKDILIISDKFFNNVIYLYAKDKYILAATAKRVSAIIDNKSFKYDVDLRDVLFFGDKVYVLSIEGEILELDHTLKLLRKVRLPFAVLSGIIIKNNTLYTLESGGYLIALDLKDFAPMIYKNNLAKKKSLFYNQDTFFYDKVYKRFE
ncbi:plasminogen-binding protein [Helicobacter sp. MIT 21-1697]|uniref:plasminogen-binding protein n=1 Tax=Helicobacter sp. MIT 21-1697 TaxID=2993733 RepID=UPI00224B58E9|nr:plasminogen-binding protein [Helicobacter sp. MIT 21-1697]MCX2717554.1 plasminogen-binding protein [Helicobacter sp. MIT 21-1697]